MDVDDCINPFAFRDVLGLQETSTDFWLARVIRNPSVLPGDEPRVDLKVCDPLGVALESLELSQDLLQDESLRERRVLLYRRLDCSASPERPGSLLRSATSLKLCPIKPSLAFISDSCSIIPNLAKRLNSRIRVHTNGAGSDLGRPIRGQSDGRRLALLCSFEGAGDLTHVYGPASQGRRACGRWLQSVGNTGKKHSLAAAVILGTRIYSQAVCACRACPVPFSPNVEVLPEARTALTCWTRLLRNTNFALGFA